MEDQRKLQDDVHDDDGYAVPIRHVKEAANRIPYGKPERCMFLMMYYTGCRTACLDKMDPKNLHGRTLYWQPSKNQRGWRKEVLPQSFVDELEHMWAHHAIKKGKFWNMTAETYRRLFNKIRPYLPPAWREKRRRMTTNGMIEEYWLQLKGLRKTFQTLEFERERRAWGDPYIASARVAKRMRYSDDKIHLTHYLENFSRLDVNGLPSLDPSELVKPGRQTRLMDFK